MKRLACCLLVLTAVACKNGDDHAAAGSANKSGQPAPATESPAKRAAAKLDMPKSGLAECDALPDLFAKFEACDKVGAEERALQEISAQQIKSIPALYTDEKDPNNKEVMKGAAVGQCKDFATKLNEAMKKAGC